MKPKKDCNRDTNIALTGNTSNVRPYLHVMLIKRGFRLVSYPAKGTKALICGTDHKVSLSLVDHKKYRVAKDNNV